MGLLADRALQGVIFDLDGTLVDSTRSVERCWDLLAGAMGIERATAPFRHGVASVPTIRAVLPTATDDEVLAWNRMHMGFEIADAASCVPIPGVFELLSALEAAGIPWGIATGCQRDLGRARLAAAGLPEPDVLICAEDYVHGKPAPDAFLVAAKAMAIDPLRAVVVEDAPAGVRSGIDAGAFVIAVTSTCSADDLQMAHAVAEGLPQVRELLLG